MDLVADWRTVLANVRTDAPDFASIRFAKGFDDEGLMWDKHKLVRSKCLWALQYDRSEHDDPLVRVALESEAAWLKVAPFQGLSDELDLAAFLLAKRPPSDAVVLMWQAKTSNFDTWVGFDSRFLGVGGVSDAIRHATETDPIDTDLLDHLRDGVTPRFTDSEVAAFLQEMARRFPASPETEPPYVWFDRSRRSYEYASARSRLVSEPRSNDEVATMSTPSCSTSSAFV